MARFTSETIDRVRDSADIVEIVSTHTDLRRQGERFVGLCPFHEERTPSFSVDAREKLYYCFGCEAGGDVFRFVSEKEGLDFPDAVEALADRYGVEIEREREDPRAEEERRRRARIGELLGRTAAFYARYLWDSPKAAKARDYLTRRGLAEEVLRGFEVGYAPSAWDQVLLASQRAGFSLAELVAAGLAQKGRRGGHYDRFRSRITFPVRDPRGRVLGFGARALSADTKPKYVNSPEGATYRKGRTLFGIDRARGPITRGGRAVVVEGYTDVLALHQSGVEETVAVMGTAITPDQIGLLAGYAEEVVLALDADRAGRDAMLRAQRVAAGRRIRLRVAAMPEGVDPADMLARGEAERFQEMIAAAQELPAFHARAILADAELGSPAGRDAALDELVPVLGSMGETISRDELMREVADRLDADPGLVARRVGAGGKARVPDRADAERPAGPERDPAAAPRPGAGGSRPARARLGPRERRERALLAMCVDLPKEGGPYLDRLTPEHLSSKAGGRALAWLRDHLEDPLAGLPRDDEELVSYITDLRMRADREPGSADAMELNYLELERGLIDDRIAAAEGGGGDPPVELQRRRAELNERIAHYHAVGA